jgi:hypothetical protein
MQYLSSVILYEVSCHLIYNDKVDLDATLVTLMPGTYFLASEEHAVSLKLSTFWMAQPDVWFAQAEAQFNLRGITADDTKYYYVLAALDQDTATRVSDLISQPSGENKYQHSKAV